MCSAQRLSLCSYLNDFYGKFTYYPMSVCEATAGGVDSLLTASLSWRRNVWDSEKINPNNADFLAAETKAKQTLKCLGAHMATVPETTKTWFWTQMLMAQA